MALASIVPKSLDDYFKDTPLGSVKRSVTNNLLGINHRQTSDAVPINKDLYGYTFFVRPQLNLSSNNIRTLRVMYNLLGNNPTSIQRFVRTTLDPRLQHKTPPTFNSLECPLVDPLQAFIPVLSNDVMSISGWPDIVSPTFTSEDGLYKEKYAQVDGSVAIYNDFDLEVGFRNTIGDPIIYLFYIWLYYQSAVFEGNMFPYPDFVRENEIDYNTRIYRLVMDKNKRVVTKIASTGVSFPVNVPTGQFFDYNKETPYNNQTDNFTIRFKSLGATYQDAILIYEFNKTVEIFNPDMRDEVRDKLLLPVPAELLEYFNNRGYPRINPDTNELNWYVKQELINQKLGTQ